MLKQIDDLDGAKRAGDLFGYPLMVKSKRLAYDGRGNAVAKNEDEIISAVNGNNFLSFIILKLLHCPLLLSLTYSFLLLNSFFWLNKPLGFKLVVVFL